jgi:fatty acid elongase 3
MTNVMLEDAVAYVADFQVIQGQTALTALYVPIVMPVLYLATLSILRALVKKYGNLDKELRNFVAVYNLLLSVGSGALWYFLGSVLLDTIGEHGFFSTFCDSTGIHVTGPLYFAYYVNYLFKYVELLDTCLLVLRGKPTPFLHVYHHSATLVLCWSQLLAQSCMQWIPIQMNLTVHIIMYS